MSEQLLTPHRRHVRRFGGLALRHYRLHGPAGFQLRHMRPAYYWPMWSKTLRATARMLAEKPEVADA